MGQTQQAQRTAKYGRQGTAAGTAASQRARQGIEARTVHEDPTECGRGWRDTTDRSRCPAATLHPRQGNDERAPPPRSIHHRRDRIIRRKPQHDGFWTETFPRSGPRLWLLVGDFMSAVRRRQRSWCYSDGASRPSIIVSELPMDPHRFDGLLRLLAATPSRRGTLRLLAGSVFGGLFTFGAGDIDAHDALKTCKKKSGKQKKKCLKKAKKHNATHVVQTSPPVSPGTTCVQPIPGHGDGTQGLNTAINATPAGGTLVLCAGTWTLTSTIEIFKNLSLRGAGAGQTILDGNIQSGGSGGVRVLRISWAGLLVPPTVTVHDLQITKGNAADGFGGGIYNEGMLTVIGSDVTGNSAPGGFGGGIYNNFGTLTMEAGSRVRGNFADFDGAGISNYGGIVMLKAGSSVTGNGAGGIHNDKDANPEGRVTLEAGAIVCANFLGDCSGPSIFGLCPSPAPPATCPV
jgi:hypothetical protein